LIFGLLVIFLNKFLSSSSSQQYHHPDEKNVSFHAEIKSTKKNNDPEKVKKTIKLKDLDQNNNLCGVGWMLDSRGVDKCVRNLKTPNPIDEKFQDFSVSPCVDFYQYACGRYASDPQNSGTDASFTYLYETAHNKSLAILKEIIQINNNKQNDNDDSKIGMFYDTCVSLRKTEEISPAVWMLIQNVESVVSSKDELVKLWGKLQIFDTILPLQLMFGINPANTQELVPILAISGIFAEDQAQLSSKRHLMQITSRLNTVYTQEQSINFAADIVAIENNLWSIRSLVEGNLVNYFAQGEFEKNFLGNNWQTILNYPFLDIPTFIENACPPSIALSRWKQAFSKRGIWCQGVDLFPKLSAIIAKYSIATWIAYTKYAILFHKYNEISLDVPDNINVDAATQQMLDQQYFYRKQYDPTYNFPWEYPRVFASEGISSIMEYRKTEEPNGLCLALTNNYFKFILDRYFISSMHDVQTEKVIQMMFDDVKGFYTYYAQFPYLKARDRDVLLDKIEKIDIYIGQPVRWNLDSVPLVLNDESYVDSVLGIRKYHVLQSFCFFVDHVVDRKEFKNSYEFTGLTRYANAAYLHQFNTIKIDAALLQTPIYSPSLDVQYHYSRIIWILAHEIAHSVDKTGIYFKNDGSVNSNQLSLPARHEITKRINCFEGSSSSNEDISDVNALVISYEMMKNHTGRSLSLDEMQSFFVSYAQLHCSAVKEVNKYYSLAFNRVNHVVEQIPDFEKSFGCSKSKTNKCSIFF
jgi:predicted metalloendopeptidase